MYAPDVFDTALNNITNKDATYKQYNSNTIFLDF